MAKKKNTSEGIETNTGLGHINFHIEGVAPLLLHSCRGVDPTDALTKRMKEITSKRTNKTDGDREQLLRYEWMLGLYHNNGVAIMPSENIEAMLIQASRTLRKGKQFQSGVWVPDAAEIDHDGPRRILELNEKGEAIVNEEAFETMRDVRRVVIKKQAVMRCRPIFRRWEIQFTVIYNRGVVDRSDITRCMQLASMQVGLGDYRPKYGRFEIVSEEDVAA